jgi:hypothetical protein
MEGGFYDPHRVNLETNELAEEPAKPNGKRARKKSPARRRYRALPSAERLRELLAYDPQSGQLTWRGGRPGRGGNRVKAGAVAGRVRHGRLSLTIDGARYQASRVVWKLMTGNDPVDQIDHRDVNPLNNAFSNLREVTHSQNMLNRRCNSRSVVGLKGVSPVRGRKGKFKAQIKSRKGGDVYLGQFDSAEEAHSVWWAAVSAKYGEFARKA